MAHAATLKQPGYFLRRHHHTSTRCYVFELDSNAMTRYHESMSREQSIARIEAIADDETRKAVIAAILHLKRVRKRRSLVEHAELDEWADWMSVSPRRVKPIFDRYGDDIVAVVGAKSWSYYRGSYYKGTGTIRPGSPHASRIATGIPGGYEKARLTVRIQ